MLELSRSGRRSLLKFGALIFALGIGLGCGNTTQECEAPELTTAEPADVTTQVLQTIAEIAYASYLDSLESAKVLSDAIDDLIADPSYETMRAARGAWLDAREPYGQTETFRFQSGPIDDLQDDGTFADGEGAEGRINAWPLAEALVDYVQDLGDPNATTSPFPPLSSDPMDPPQIVNNIISDNAGDTSVITKDFIASYNAIDGDDERAVATGYHAIEFLLWGQDLNEEESGAAGGNRPWQDYLPVDPPGGDPACEDLTCDARAAYLQVAMELLIEDLQRVVDAWAPNTPGNYRETFVEGGNDTIATVMSALREFGEGELGGERMQAALNAQSQEDEHSCFSDNTHRDVLLNALGMANIILGRYEGATAVSGKGLYDLLVESDQTAAADALRDATAEVMARVRDIDDEVRVSGIRFDQLLNQGIDQPELVAAITALVDQAETVEDAERALGL